jgi:hypothetical protein
MSTAKPFSFNCDTQQDAYNEDSSWYTLPQDSILTILILRAQTDYLRGSALQCDRTTVIVKSSVT